MKQEYDAAGAPRRIDVFVHVSKSAGSTVRSLISRRYPLDRILYFEPGSAAWLKHTSGKLSLRRQIESQNTLLVTGHHPFGLHATIPHACRYFGIIREPMARQISEYYTAIGSTNHPLHRDLIERNASVWDFLDNAEFSRGDHLAQMLAGRSEGDPMATARTAVANIHESFATVIVAERFDESVLLLAKSLGWDVPIYTKRNVAPISEGNRAARAAIAEIAREKHRDAMAPDRHVYEEAGSFLTRRIEIEGEDFQRALDAFRAIESEVDRIVPAAAFIGYSFEHVDLLPAVLDQLIDSENYRIVADYLRQPPKGPVPNRNYVGHVDTMKNGVVHGWAADMGRSASISVELRRGGLVIAEAPAIHPRMDVRRSGLAGEFCGFQLRLPETADELPAPALFFENSTVPLPINPKVGRPLIGA